MRVILVDDEPHARAYLRQLLEQHFGWLQLLGEADSVSTALELISAYRPDLLLLDIKLGQDTAFDLLEALGDFRCQVIFITAHDAYAIRAFRIAAVDYLLKPLQCQALAVALQRARELHALYAAQPVWRDLSTIVQELQRASKTITLPERTSYRRVPIAQITYCCTRHAGAQVYLQNGDRLMVNKELRELQQQLETSGFMRCHQSYLVNEAHVSSIQKEDGQLLLVLTDGSKVPVARANLAWVRMRLQM
ncbi:LytR/AlgR family response regulator transcription factor [Phnomibacter ginsenosidimutans]|uniref:Response regulator n=1 Tax=Phnomibacter ginsenosidimutans TaxID=2676868 RepID=A0A6I6H0U2_9BACT|nr:LytTR family DNA-binding domain-containing protein [Phnomibacter ginsenosidimutans]QGW28291.1 response regulator [Phnomibacter ginsenosidimutans]